MNIAMPTPAADSRAVRLLPAAGPAFAVLMVVAALTCPMPPGGDVSPASQPLWLADHVGPVIAQSYLRAGAALAFVLFAVALAGVLRRVLPPRTVLPDAALIVGTLTGGLLLLSQAASIAAALLVRTGGAPDAVRVLAAMQDALLNLSSLPAVLLFAALGLGALRTGRLLPRWLTGLTLLGVPFALLDTLSYDSGPLESIGILGLVFFLAWSLLVGGALLARPVTDLAVPMTSRTTAEVS